MENTSKHKALTDSKGNSFNARAKRRNWIDWTIVFQQEYHESEIKRVEEYIINYVRDEIIKEKATYWLTYLDHSWRKSDFNSFEYSFIANFISKGINVTSGLSKSSPNPPQPTPPPPPQL